VLTTRDFACPPDGKGSQALNVAAWVSGSLSPGLAWAWRHAPPSLPSS